MQRVSSFLPSWDRTKSGSKKRFDKVWVWADKLGAPVNKVPNRIGSEAFWPTTLDKESDKAARILRSFCKDGFTSHQDRSQSALDGSIANPKQRILKQIPQSVIQNAVGLAIFTTMRSGLWISGAGGSGVLVARLEDGSWSPPSGILLHTAGLGFLVGVDIYDCVVVINNKKALDAFTKGRATVGGEISAVAGPLGVGGVVEQGYNQLSRPVFTYLKSRGFYAGVQVDGTVVLERSDENARFYGERIRVEDILAGKAQKPPIDDFKMLMETLKAAEGRTDADRDLMEELEGQPAPGDVGLMQPTRAYEPSFGIPEPSDPDPFGVLALEKAGLEIREAGSNSRPSSTQFEFRPSPTSPAYSQFQRRSLGMESLASRTRRTSFTSIKSHASTDRATQTMDASNQTIDDDSPSSSRRGSPATSPLAESGRHVPMNLIKEEPAVPLDYEEPEEVDFTKIDLGPYANLTRQNSDEGFDGSGTTANSEARSPGSQSVQIKVVEDGEMDGEMDGDMSEFSDISDDEDGEEAVVYEAASAQPARIIPTAQVIQARGKIINMPKRIVPAVPPRSPMRRMDTGENPLPSPVSMKDGFTNVKLHHPSTSTHSVTSPTTPLASSTTHEHDEEEATLEEPIKMVDHSKHDSLIKPAIPESSLSASLSLGDKVNGDVEAGIATATHTAATDVAETSKGYFA